MCCSRIVLHLQMNLCCVPHFWSLLVFLFARATVSVCAPTLHINPCTNTLRLSPSVFLSLSLCLSFSLSFPLFRLSSFSFSPPPLPPPHSTRCIIGTLWIYDPVFFNGDGDLLILKSQKLCTRNLYFFTYVSVLLFTKKVAGLTRSLTVPLAPLQSCRSSCFPYSPYSPYRVTLFTKNCLPYRSYPIHSITN